jgi:hypothetical protein
MLRAEPPRPKQAEDSPYNVYVMLGFHTSFYHSWRGDTPDEAGFGTDIRIVRQIIKMLDEANARGLDARGYWDFDVYWTLEEIIPAHAPDIIEGIRQRVQAGLDEVLPGPYNNGANHAATEEEFRTAVAYAVENPYRSGLRQVFGQVTPIYRAQEGMYTTGQNRVLLEEGIEGIISLYATIPSYNSISTFIPPLPPQARHNPLWLRSSPHEVPIVLLPCISPGDLVNYISLEMWMLQLRKLQTTGQVKSDLLLHLNFDADAETWIPVDVPKLFTWFPNSGGLMEYIGAVNKYPWAKFTVPSQYLDTHPPKAEITVRQDVANGAFDGNYSWAEKFTSLGNWSELERSRLHSYRAISLSRGVDRKLAADIDRRLWQGTDSAFFNRVVGLSTTHFGMSTPIISEGRQAKAETVIGAARAIAAQAEKDAALAIRRKATVEDDTLYELEIYNFARSKNTPSKAAHAIVRVPLILPPAIEEVLVKDLKGREVQASLVNVEQQGDATRAAQLWFAAHLGPEERRIYRVEGVARPTTLIPCMQQQLKNGRLELNLAQSSGIASFWFEGQEIGGRDFLKPFITYRSGKEPRNWGASPYQLEDLAGESWHGVSRARIKTTIPMDTPHGRCASELRYTFTVFDDLPCLLVDAEANYAYTPPGNMIHTLQQKLRRLLDLRWVEVSPFQLNPKITAPAERPLRIWKHNYLGITAHYDLNYGHINPKNSSLDSFNHQVTAGWVAVSNGKLGLLLAEDAETLSSLAFCPMRLREREGIQHLSLNPFGSYFGKQLDYSHLGGNGTGTELATVASGSLRPNGPSFNGHVVRFSLLLVPYLGDEPPDEIQDDAEAFFYPCGVIYLRTPAGIDAVVPDDIRALVAAKERKQQAKSSAPLPPPTALLANPSHQALDLVWDPPRDDRVTGYELRWRRVEADQWQSQIIPHDNRFQVPSLENGARYVFQMRALAESRESQWTDIAQGVPGPVSKAVSPFAALSGASIRTLLKVIYYGLVHGWTTR